jgi:broad specificity phosphatase PhoE
VPIIRYVSHPEVVVDPNTPVPQWSISEQGRLRIAAMCKQPWVEHIGRVVSSGETKAIETAQIVAAHRGLDVEIRLATGETDRSSTGFVPHERHEQLANAFFANPTKSVEGWERAIDVQSRVVSALDDLFATDADVLVVGHGAAGTLWYTFLVGLPIRRTFDQTSAGQYFSVDTLTRHPIHHWLPIDT